MIRLDKYVANGLKITRSTANKLIKKKQIKVNEEIVTIASFQVKENDIITYLNKQILFEEYRYYLINKPKGYICSLIDEDYPSILNLIDDVDLKIAGRLDVDTTGLLIITNDGTFIHELTSPKKHLPKTYLVTYDGYIQKEVITKFSEGFTYLDEEYKPSKLVINNDHTCLLTLQEGKFHQVKLMMASVNCVVTDLKRIKIGNLFLDEEKIAPGQYQKLKKDELIKLIW